MKTARAPNFWLTAALVELKPLLLHYALNCRTFLAVPCRALQYRAGPCCAALRCAVLCCALPRCV